jgi:nucleoside-diphosphate-sugar epimerase
MNAFVAGGTGVLGRRVVERLVAAGHTVHATARTAAGATRLRELGAVPVDANLYDPTALRAAVSGQDVVLRLTTKIPPLMKLRSEAAWRETGRLRTVGAQALVEACLATGVRTYVHESVTFVYGSGGDGWLTEDSPVDLLAPGSPLHQAVDGESHARRFTAQGGKGLVLRFAGFYGVDSAQSRDMAALARRGWLALVGPSRSWFSSIALDDAAEATVAALRAPAGVYNVADDEPLRLADYVTAIGQAVGARRRPRQLPAFLGPLVFGVTWPYLTRSQRVSAARLHQATGWTPAVKNAREGWRLTAAAWAESGPSR